MLTGAGPGTWSVRRNGSLFALKLLESPSWEYPLRVAAALRAAGWPTPSPVAEPLVVPGGAWVLLDWLPGSALAVDQPRERGRLLASLHLAAATSGIDAPRDGFPSPAAVVLDFEASHHTFQVADFALSWRGYQDDVIRGYDSVRPLSDLEWQLIRPAYQSWLFLGLRDALTAGGPGKPGLARRPPAETLRPAGTLAARLP